MRKIKDIISKPSEALQAMVDGLLEQDARPDFEIEMNEWGSYNRARTKCFGCAATCTIQKLLAVNFTPDNIINRYDMANDIDTFEDVMNLARTGALRMLFDFFGVKNIVLGIDDKILSPNFCLENHNWRQEPPKVTAHIKLLQEAGY